MLEEKRGIVGEVGKPFHPSLTDTSKHHVCGVGTAEKHIAFESPRTDDP